ncbi:MAG: alkaline ceramidase 3-like protein [Piptocephalis tieghemiana]|nr:MAG: alkaline ceramidase 3-like protein [Piptocephalis tieghemiana]
MHHFDLDDPSALPHFWRRTATLDWCEQNYVMCTYIAEFWNTVSNLAFLSLAFLGAYLVHRTGQEKRFLLAYASFGAVGLGSWLFHMTLSYEAQLLDELPMIYATCILIWVTLETKPKCRYGLALPFLLASTAIAITAAYIINKNPILHQIAYGSLTAVLVFRAGYLFQCTRDPKVKALIRSLLTQSILFYGLGFLLWNIDNQFCPQVRALRASLPSSLSWVLQLHAWWHVFTGLGGYTYIAHMQYVRQVLLGEGDAYRIKFLLFGTLPIVFPRHRQHHPSSSASIKVE